MAVAPVWYRAQMRALFCLLLLTSAAHADPLVFSGDAETHRVELGRLDGEPVTATWRVQHEGHDLYALELVVTVTPKQGKPVTQQLLHDRMDAASLALALDGTHLTATYTSAHRFVAEGTKVTLRWRWQPEARRWAEQKSQVHDLFAEGRAALDAALQRGDLATGRAWAALLGPTPDGGHSFVDAELMSALLLATHRVAAERHRAGNTREAAALIWDLLTRPPVTHGEPSPPAGAYCLPATPRACAGEGAFNALPVTSAHTAALNDAGFFLLASNEHAVSWLAIDLLEQVVRHAPDRAVAKLNLADALRRRARPDDPARARALYRAYRDARRAAGQPVPARVESLLQE